MPIEAEIVHVHIVVIGAVLYAVDHLQDHEFAGEALFEFHTPIYKARRRKDPKNRQAVEVFSALQSHAQFVGL